MGVINQGSHNWGAPSCDGDWPKYGPTWQDAQLLDQAGRNIFFRARPGGFLFEVMKPT